MDKKSNKYISLQTAAKYCDYSQEYLSLRARQGKLKALKIGRNWVTTKKWIKEYLGEVNDFKNQRAEKKILLAKLHPSLQPVPRAWRIAIALALVFVLGGAGVIFAYPYFEPTLKLAGNLIQERIGEIKTDIGEFATGIDKEVDKISSHITESIYGFATNISIEATFLGQEISENIDEKIQQTQRTIPHSFYNIGTSVQTTLSKISQSLQLVAKGTQEIGKGVQKGIVFVVGETARRARGAADGIREWLVRPVKNFAIETTNELIRYISQDIKTIKRFTQNTGRTVLGTFKKITQKVVSIFEGREEIVLREEFVLKEEIEKLVSEKFVTREQLEALQQTIQKLKEEGLPVREIIKEVSRITQITPVKEITKEITKIDDEELKKLKSQIAEIQQWEKDIQTLQILTSKLQTHPPYTQVSTAPIYIGSQGIQIGGAAILASLGVSGSAGITNLGVGGSTSLGSDSSDQLSVNATADFSAPTTIKNTFTVGTGTTTLTVDSTGNLTTTGNLTVQGTQTGSGIVSYTASSTSPVLTVNQTGTGNIVQFKDAGNIVFQIVDGGAVTLTSTSTPQFKLAYDNSNYFTASVSSAGNTTLLSTGGLTATSTGAFALGVAGVERLSIATSGNIALTGDLTLSGSATTTGKAYFTYSPQTAGESNALDASLIISPSSAKSDANLLTVADNGTWKVRIDREGDIFTQGNLTIAGSLNQATTTVANLRVEGWSLLGDSTNNDYTIIKGWTTITAESTSTSLTVSQDSTGRIVDFQDAGTSVFTIADGGFATLAVNASTTPSFLIKGADVSPTFSTSTYFGIVATSTFVGNIVDIQKDGTTQFVITADGKVGIGTTTPQAMLHIESTIEPQLIVGYDSNKYFELRVTSGGSIQFRPSIDSAQAFQFQTKGGSSTVLNIDTSGRMVGIGTTTPDRKLDVAGSARVQADLDVTGKTYLADDLIFSTTSTISASAGILQVDICNIQDISITDTDGAQDLCGTNEVPNRVWCDDSNNWHVECCTLK